MGKLTNALADVAERTINKEHDLQCPFCHKHFTSTIEKTTCPHCGKEILFYLDSVTGKG